MAHEFNIATTPENQDDVIKKIKIQPMAIVFVERVAGYVAVSHLVPREDLRPDDQPFELGQRIEAPTRPHRVAPEPNSEGIYRITTWDWETEAFTPQAGVPPRVIGMAGLRSAIRALREAGYEATKADSAVLIEREDHPSSLPGRTTN